MFRTSDTQRLPGFTGHVVCISSTEVSGISEVSILSSLQTFTN